jgi:hypothetical protein
LLSFTGLIVSIIIGLIIHHFNIVFAFLINLPFPTLGVLIAYKCTDWIFKFIKGGAKKKQIIMLSIFLFILKYIVIVTPLIIGLIINGVNDTMIFNSFALVIGALIYPTTTLIVQ